MNKIILYICLAATTAALYLISNFTFNSSASEPVGLYHITSRPLTRNGLVLLKDPLKRLVGVPGDEIRMAPEGVYVNDQLIANSAVPPVPRTHIINMDPSSWGPTNTLSWATTHAHGMAATRGQFPAA
jgi:type IV secretory pathway protease TraF